MYMGCVVLGKISTETKSASACMVLFAPFFFVAILKSELQNSVYQLGWVGVGLGPTLADVSWYLESAKSVLCTVMARTWGILGMRYV